MPPVWAFVFDDENEAKLAVREIYPEQAQQMLSNKHRVEPNKRKRRGTHLVIGYDGLDGGGRCLTLPIEPTRERGVWYPVTGWESSPAEQHRLERK